MLYQTSLIVFVTLAHVANECNGEPHLRLRLVPPMNISVTCPAVNDAPEGAQRTAWFFPNGSRILSGGRITTKASSGHLHIVDPVIEDLGSYICVTVNTQRENATDLDAALRFVDIYSVGTKTLQQRAWFGGMAALCVLAAVIFLVLVYKFRYRGEPTKGKTTTPGAASVNTAYSHDEMLTAF